MKRTPRQPNQSKALMESSLPTNRAEWGFIIASVIWELIGRLFTGAMVNSARERAMGDYLYRMNQVTMLERSVDLIMVVLVLIGIFLLVRTYLARSKAAKKI